MCVFNLDDEDWGLRNLDKPGQEEDHGDEEDESFPRRKTVESLVHDEHPAFLWRRHIHREEAGRCNTHNIIKSNQIKIGFINEWSKTDYRVLQSATELRQQLHWLPVRQRIIYKLTVVTYKTWSTGTLAYLSQLIHHSRHL